MRRLLLVLVALLPLLAGCWDQQAIEQLGFVGSVLVDGAPGSLKVMYSVIIPSKLPTGTNPGSSDSTTLITSTGRDLAEATRRADLLSSKRLCMAHVQAVLLSERFARAGGAAGVYDYFARGTKRRDISWVLVVPDDQVQAVASLTPANAAYPGEAMANMNLAQRQQGKVPSIRLFEFANQIVTPGRDATAPLLSAGKTSYAFSGTALFNQGKLVGTLSATDTEDLDLLMRRSQQPSLVVPCNAQGTVSIELMNPRRTMRAIVQEGRLVGLSIRIQAAAHVDQANICPVNFASPRQEQALTTATAGVISHRIESVMAKVQHFHSDPFGFGEVVRVTNPAVWQAIHTHWRDVYAQLPIYIEVRVTPNNSGLLNESLDGRTG